MLQPTRLISTPFAQEGEKTEIQNVTGEFDNSATYRLGFPPITMQSIRLGGKPPKGTDFNGVLFDITENISFLCKGGRYQYNAGLSTLIGGYPEGSNLLLDDNVTEVVSTVAGNQNNPNTDMTGWILKPNRTTAEYVLDASGESQQQVNYNGGSKWHSRVGGYLENERVVLANGDIVKSTIDGNTNDPNVDNTGWFKDAYEVFGSTGYTYHSKIVANGLDQSAEVQAEFNAVGVLNSIVGGINYSFSRRGIVLATKLVFPSATNINIDFTGTTLKIPDGTNTLDTDVFRFNSIKRSIVFGLDIDGNSANIPDDTSGIGSWIGRCILFRIGNNSQDCIFYNTKLMNALYCGSQWGNNIRNITFQNIEYDNIGEHVFYISGGGGGLNKGVHFKGIKGGSFGVNPNAGLNNHETLFVKSSQTIGDNDNFTIEDGEFNQIIDNGYSYAVLSASSLNRFKIKNIKVGGVLDAVVYPGKNSFYGVIDGVFAMDDTVTTRLVYSHPANTAIKYYTANNVHLPNSQQQHLQIFDEISNSVLSDYVTSNPVSPVYELGKSCLISNTRFLNKTDIRSINHDLDFVNCKFLNNSVISGLGVIDNMGVTTWVDGKYVTFDACEFANTAGYSWVTNNNNARVRVRNGKGIMRNPFNRAGTTMKLLDIDGVTVPYSGNPLLNVNPVAYILRGIIGYDGTNTRNFLKYKGQITVANGATTGSIDLYSVIASPAIAIQDVQILPAFQLGTNGISSFVHSLSGKVVTITTNAAATAACTFYIAVDVSS